MFYPECESLANEQPGLRRVIAKVDEVFHKTGPGSIIRPEDVASHLGEKESQICGIFDALVAKGLVNKERYIECPECSTLNSIEEYQKAIADEDEFECTQCQLDLTLQEPAITRVYRLNPLIPRETKKTPSSERASVTPPSQQFSEKIPQPFLDDPFRNTPVLRYYSNQPKLLEVKPFNGKLVFVLLHFLRDLMPFVKACQGLGLDMKSSVFFYKDYPYPQRDAIKKWLEEQGTTVAPHSHFSQYLKQLAGASSNLNQEILIVEDGGLLAPAIHREFTSLVPVTIGAVEQTTRGIMNAEDWEKERTGNSLQFPIISVATSELKNRFEPPYIAEAVVKNIERLRPNVAFPGLNAAVMGYGSIGKEVVSWLRKKRANVTVFEPDSTKRFYAEQDGITLASTAALAARGKKLVIGTSGRQSIDAGVIAALSHGCDLVSASSEQYEIDVVELQMRCGKRESLLNDNGDCIGTTFILPPDDRQINLLANGYPVNFWGFHSMPEQASDLIMTLIFLCAAELALGNCTTPGVNAGAVNKIAEQYKLAKKYSQIHG